MLECGDKGPNTLEETFTMRALADSFNALLSPAEYLCARVIDRRPAGRVSGPDDPVRFELKTALGLGLPVVPVLVEQATMPEQVELPPSLAGLPGINAVIIPAEPYFTEGVSRRSAAIESLTASVPSNAPEAPKRFWTGCGNPINPNQAFCTRCGRRVGPS